MKRVFRVGARGSLLSVAQTEGALAFLAREFPGAKFDFVPFSTPGDRDLKTPIERSAPDFFTRDLDDAVRDGRIDFAVHSAKDLPDPVGEGLDWFWLPNREDPRDAWVTRAAAPLPQSRTSRLKIGISSERRRAFAAARFPQARLSPIRGAIDDRLRQLVAGDYDAVLMAMAGVKRLYPVLPEELTVTPIPLEALEPPEAQGVLAVTFRAGDERMQAIRSRFVKAVRFVSAGVGSASLCTLAGLDDLAAADVVLYDDLLGAELIRRAAAGGGRARLVHVGKRCGAHSMKQDAITRLICDEARKGRRVVRLKGGDAGVFGRLAEETDALAALKIPFVVRPGVSALTAATTGTGLLLTRRGEARGFTVYTPRSTAADLNLVAFMATRVVAQEGKRLIREGWKRDTPCAMVWDAAGPGERVAMATLGTAKFKSPSGNPPGLFVVGDAARSLWPESGELAGRRVLITASEAVQARVRLAVEDRGGRAIPLPLVEMRGRPLTCDPCAYDILVLTSPSAVRVFFETYAGDRRRLPRFYTCGAGTDAELRRHGVVSDLVPESDFSSRGLIGALRGLDLRGRRVLRLRSAKAGGAVAAALRRRGAKVDDVVLYDNVSIAPPGPLPNFDAVHFASASAVEAFLAAYGERPLRGKAIYVMGEPTLAALPRTWARRAERLVTWGSGR